MTKGKFIFFEGMDFAGKTTCLKAFAKILDEKGIDYIITREPGGSKTAELIREILLNGEDINTAEQALLFQVARSNHCRNIIQPALDAGKWVLSDRYIVSSLVYQHDQKDLILNTTKLMNLIEPDLMVYAHCGYETTIQRKGVRDDVNYLDNLYTKYYHKYEKLFNYYAELFADETLCLDTNKPREDLDATMQNFIETMLGSNCV